MNQSRLDATVEQLLLERPSRVRIFEDFRIDYCCGGFKPLRQAIEENQLDADEVLAALDRESSPDTKSINLAAESISGLCDHIERTHHAYLKQELPRIEAMSHKVASRHGDYRPQLVELYRVFTAFKSELDSHMMKEEQILFPLCRALDGADQLPPSHCGSVNNPIAVMVQEHDDAGQALARMRALTDGYTAPPDACNTFRALYDNLLRLEKDMETHMHTENNVLFPRASRLEAQLVRRERSCGPARGQNPALVCVLHRLGHGTGHYHRRSRIFARAEQ